MEVGGFFYLVLVKLSGEVVVGKVGVILVTTGVDRRLDIACLLDFLV